MLRNIALAALVAVPLMWSSAPVSAQNRGQDRAAVATAQQQPTPNGNGEVNRQTEAPRGIMRRFVAGLRNLPRGIARRFGVEEATAPAPEPEPEPQPEPEPEPEPEPCVTQLVYVGGMPMLQDCNGNLTPLMGLPG